jgi:perosamine synthetase
MPKSECNALNNKILYTKPSITDLEISFAADAAVNGWGEKCYDYIVRFESTFKEHLGVRYAIATSSCTGALHMGLAALEIGPGDEVIMADTNWIATAAPIVHLGAKPVFVDILPDTWCIDPKSVTDAITPNTKAVIATHLYGNLCEMDRLLSIGEKYSIPIIEDAAEAIGSIYRGKRAGSMGKFGAFSFHGSKTITTGEGGMFVTNEKELYEKVLTLSNHGRRREQEKLFWPDVVGFKYKISNIQAAIGCAQLERVDELVARKKEIMDYYRNSFAPFVEIKMNPESHGTLNGSWMPTLVFSSKSGVTREIVSQAMKIEGVDARPFFWPLSSTCNFSPVRSNVNSWDIPRRAINLPSFHDITESELDRIIYVIKNVLDEGKLK